MTGAAGVTDSALVEHFCAQAYENVIALKQAECDLVDTSATFAAFERRRPDRVR